jgi:hypothetical protein
VKKKQTLSEALPNIRICTSVFFLNTTPKVYTRQEGTLVVSLSSTRCFIKQ